MCFSKKGETFREGQCFKCSPSEEEFNTVCVPKLQCPSYSSKQNHSCIADKLIKSDSLAFNLEAFEPSPCKTSEVLCADNFHSPIKHGNMTVFVSPFEPNQIDIPLIKLAKFYFLPKNYVYSLIRKNSKQFKMVSLGRTLDSVTLIPKGNTPSGVLLSYTGDISAETAIKQYKSFIFLECNSISNSEVFSFEQYQYLIVLRNKQACQICLDGEISITTVFL